MIAFHLHRSARQCAVSSASRGVVHCEALESRIIFSGATAIHVNAGGPALIDSIGRSFEADAGFVGGQVVQIAPYDVPNTADDSLFLTQRQGNAFTFSHAIANGHYSMWLEFVDPASTAAGQRMFDVSIEGAEVLNGFDVFANGGGTDGRAVTRSFDVTVSDGQLDAAFTAVIGQAIVSAIVLLPTKAPDVAVPYSWDGLSETTRTMYSANNLRNIAQSLFIFAGDHRGHFPVDLAALAEYLDRGSAYTTYASPRTSTALPRGENSPVEHVGWVAARRDFVYLNPILSRNVSETTVLAYENPDRVEGDLNVLFGDGSARLLDRAAAATTIGFPDVPPSDPPGPRPIVPARDPRITQSQLNLSQMAQDWFMYSYNNRGFLPSDPGVQYPYLQVKDITRYINPRTTTVPPPANWSDQQKAVWINLHSDYVYFGDGQRLSRFAAYDVLAYEKPTGLEGGINLLFADGHVEFREFGWANETIAHQLPPAANPPWLQTYSNTNFTLADNTLTLHSGSATLTGDAASTTPGLNVIVEAGASLRISSNEHIGALTVDGLVDFSTYQYLSKRCLRVTDLSIGSGARLDLANNDLIVDYGAASPLSTITGWIASARHGGDWSGNGLRAALGARSHTLGAMESADYLSIHGSNAAFDGEPLDSSMVLVKYTYCGDTDFSGAVNFDDYSRIDLGFYTQDQSHFVFKWLVGDFDFNNSINFDDYSLIDLAFNTQAGVL